MTPDQLKTATREQRLAWFALQVIRESWDATDVCGADIQEWAAAAGLIYPDEVNEDTDLNGIENAEHLEIGDTFYREARDLHEAQPST
ncbi:MAG: hypothetical protein IPL32_18765 [Chloracidobacterium sp.]|nr:hypothetical protein [Chloracidobacterium sp.]MBK8467859.1 hypothetical protein [Chloracidobacterium sp.]